MLTKCLNPKKSKQMTSIKRLLSALCWAICFSSVSNAQVSTSGELINNGSWSGAVYGADPGGCCASISGSGPLYDTSTGTIMFSYGQATISQNIGLQNALGSSGIVLHGYNYSWDYRLVPNGDNFSSDNLIFNTRIRDASGNILFDRTYDYSGPVAPGINDAWQTQSGTISFDPMYGASTLSLSITGRDGGFWAGYYGPEVRNFSMSVNYTVDPCVNDPLYSTSCAGYWEAFLQAFGAFFFGSPEPEETTIEYTLVPSTTTTTSMPEETTTGEVKVDAGGIEVSSTGELSVPDGIPEEAKVEEKEKKAVDMNLIMSVVREATDDSKALAVVNQSIEDSTSDSANPDFTGSPISLTGELLDDPIMQAIFLRSSFSEKSSSEDQGNFAEETTTTSQQQSTVQESQQQQVVVEQTQEQQEEVTVKQNVEPNEAASGVDIASIAVSPTGFNDYLTKSLNDARFYEEKEIYAGQAVVDNRRVQRLLNGASDRLHREMVDQQYRRQ